MKLSKSIKKIIGMICLIPVLGVVKAQDAGIQFEKGLTWKQIKAKAQAENKYIFMDCYATWCGPCKAMAKDVFTRKDVGNFFNKYFINVAVQMDKTPNDEQEVRTWYQDAADLTHTYQIHAFPTFLFFSPNGNLVHKVLGYQEAGAFLEKSSNALDVSKQYVNIKATWDQHTIDSVYLLNALITMMDASDLSNAKKVGTAYTNSLHDPITSYNIRFFSDPVNGFITSSKDQWFQLLLSNSTKVDNLDQRNGGRLGSASHLLSGVIFNEEVRPILKMGPPVRWRKITERLKLAYPSLGRSLLTEEEKWFQNEIGNDCLSYLYRDNVILPLPDWSLVTQNLKTKYPDYDFDKIYLMKKIAYLGKKAMYREQSEAANELLTRYGNSLGDFTLNNTCWYIIVLHCEDKKILLEALKWMKKIVTQDSNTTNFPALDTYANLLYKTGNLKEAMLWEEKAIVASNQQKEFRNTLEKMKNGLPTWLDNSPVPQSGSK